MSQVVEAPGPAHVEVELRQRPAGKADFDAVTIADQLCPPRAARRSIRGDEKSCGTGSSDGHRGGT